MALTKESLGLSQRGLDLVVVQRSFGHVPALFALVPCLLGQLQSSLPLLVLPFSPLT